MAHLLALFTGADRHFLDLHVDVLVGRVNALVFGYLGKEVGPAELLVNGDASLLPQLLLGFLGYLHVLFKGN